MVAPRLRNPDGTLQRSVRGFPTLWRLATEYFFLRKLAPRSHALNAYYAGDFDHGSARSVEWVMGSCFLVRRTAADEVGMFDEDFFLFSEETDWFYRFHQAGWAVWFTPDAEAVHVGGASHGGRMYVENVRGIVRWFAKHRGPREADRARGLLVGGAAAARRGLPRRARPDVPRRRTRALMRRIPWELLALPALGISRALPDTGWGLWVRLAAATACLLLPGALIARGAPGARVLGRLRVEPGRAVRRHGGGVRRALDVDAGVGAARRHHRRCPRLVARRAEQQSGTSAISSATRPFRAE